MPFTMTFVNEEEKGKGLFERYCLQTDQRNEAERHVTMAAITQHYDDTLIECITHEKMTVSSMLLVQLLVMIV